MAAHEDPVEQRTQSLNSHESEFLIVGGLVLLASQFGLQFFDVAQKRFLGRLGPHLGKPQSLNSFLLENPPAGIDKNTLLNLASSQR